MNNINELKIFKNTEFGEIGVLVIDGREYFPATDCAKILGYKNPQKAIREHCKGVNEMVTPSAGGSQKKNFITEGNLYRLIVKSKLPEAEKFESWIFDEVLPQIRQTGGYIPVKEEDDEESIMAKALIIANKTLEKKDRLIKEQKEKIVELQPKADFTDKLLKSDDVILVREYSKLIQEQGFKLGEKKLFQWFRDNGYLNKQNEPYQKYMDYFVVTESTYYVYGEPKLSHTTKITPKGQLYFFKKLRESFDI